MVKEKQILLLYYYSRKKTLYLNALLEQSKFCDRGNKDGVVRGLNLLQEAGLVNLIEINP